MATTSKAPKVGYEPGDFVYAHADSGPRVLKVLASGKDGFTGETEDGERVKVPHDRYLGHQRRVKHAYTVADQGEDGALLVDETGTKRFIKGKPPNAPDGKPNRDNAHRFASVHSEDLKLDGMGCLSKALMLAPLPPLPDGMALLMKAAKAGETWITVHPNGPDSKGTPVLIKDGKVVGGAGGKLDGKELSGAKGSKVKAAADNKGRPKNGQRHAEAKHKHGDTVAFRHGDVEGSGKIVGSGQDGVTVQAEDGREHLVRHDALLPEHPPETQSSEGSAASPEEALTSAKTAHQAALEKYQAQAATPPAKNKKAHAAQIDVLREDLRIKAGAMAEAMEAAGYDAFTGKKRRDMEHVYAALGDYLKTTFDADQMRYSSTIKHDVPSFFVAGATGEPIPTLLRAANDYAQVKQDQLLNAAYAAGKKADPELDKTDSNAKLDGDAKPASRDVAAKPKRKPA